MNPEKYTFSDDAYNRLTESFLTFAKSVNGVYLTKPPVSASVLKKIRTAVRNIDRLLQHLRGTIFESFLDEFQSSDSELAESEGQVLALEMYRRQNPCVQVSYGNYCIEFDSRFLRSDKETAFVTATCKLSRADDFAFWIGKNNLWLKMSSPDVFVRKPWPDALRKLDFYEFGEMWDKLPEREYKFHFHEQILDDFFYARSTDKLLSELILCTPRLRSSMINIKNFQNGFCKFSLGYVNFFDDGSTEQLEFDAAFAPNCVQVLKDTLALMKTTIDVLVDHKLIS